MPQAIALAVFGTTATAGLTIFGVSVAAGTIGGVLLSAAGSLLLSTAANALLSSGLQRTPTAEAPEFRGISKSATGKRIVPVGRLQIGGSMAMEPRIKDGKLYILIAHCVGPIMEREKHLVDGREVTVGFDGYVQEDKFQHDGESKLQIFARSGYVPSSAYQKLTAVFPDWTADHRIDGLATTLMILHPSPNVQSMFPRLADTQYSAIIKGVGLRDPRTGLSGWSENPALGILDYLENRYGTPTTDINDASFITAANLCDTPRVGPSGSRASYTMGGGYALDEAPKSVLQAMLNVCDGRFTFNSEGQIGLEVGGDKSASVSLSKDAVKGVMRWDRGRPLAQAYNVLSGTYTDQSLGFVTQSTEPLINSAGITRLGRRKDSSIDLNFAPDWETATALMFDRMIRDNPKELGRIRYDLQGLAAIGQRYINIDVDVTPTRTVTAKVEVLDVHIPNPVTHVDIEVALLDDSLHEISISDYGNPPVISLPDDEAIKLVPTGLTASPSGTKISASGFSAGIFVTWDAAPYSSLIPVLQFSVANAEAWQAVATSEDAISAKITGLVEGTEYDVRLAWIVTGGGLDSSDYTTVEDVMASASTVIPLAPTAFTVTDQASGNALVSLTASSSADLWRTNVYRDGVLILAQPSDALAIISFTDAPGAGTYTYTVTSENFSNGVSTPETSTTPVTTTIT